MDSVTAKQEQYKFILDAIDMFGQSQNVSENFYSARFHQSLMFRRIGRYHDALRQFTKVQEKLPKDKSVYFERGLVYQAMGNHQLAIEDFMRAIEIDKHYAKALFCVGISRLKSRQIEQAIENFEDAASESANHEN